MGTDGLKGYRYRGLYFMRYNHSDSYPRTLGRSIVRQIPRNPEDFRIWIERMKNFYEREHDRISNTVIPEKRHGSYIDDYYYFPSACPPESDGETEWAYVIDLDRLLLTVDGTAHFCLDKLPPGDTWMKYLTIDGLNNRCLDLNCPTDFIGDPTYGMQPTTPPSVCMKANYRMIMVGNIEAWYPEETTCSCAVAAELAKGAAISRYSQYSRIDEISHSSDPGDIMTYHDRAISLMHAAAPGAIHVTDHDCPKGNKDSYLEYEMDNLALLNPLSRRSFWFRNCLVTITTCLEVPENLEVEVGLMASKLTDTGSNACTGLIWSVKHLVIVKYNAGKIQYSPAIPVLDPRSALWPECMLSGLRLLSHYLSRNPQGLNGPGTSVKAESLVTGLDRRTNIPSDIIATLAPFTDCDTHRVLQEVSKGFRQVLLMQPRIGQYTILRLLDDTSFVPGNGNVSHFLAMDQKGEHHTLRFVLWSPYPKRLVPPLNKKLWMFAPTIGNEWRRSFETVKRDRRQRMPLLSIGRVKEAEACEILDDSNYDESEISCGTWRLCRDSDGNLSR